MSRRPAFVLRPVVACALVVAAVAAVAVTGTGATGASSAKPSTRPALDATTRRQLEQTLTQVFTDLGVPGALAAVEIGGERWVAKRGVANTATDEPVVLTTHSRIGSVTKTMTGTIILQLVDQKKLSLDDTVDRWFPDLPDAREITIRDLGTMASGIASYTKDEATVTKYLGDPRQVWTPEQLISIGTSLPRSFAPGDGFEYSNTNFVMLGRIIEQVTGKPFAEVIRTRIFDRLKMRGSDYPLDTALADPHWQGYTDQTPSGEVADATDWSPTFASSAGEATSTLRDVLVWAKAVGTGSLLEPETQAARLVGNPASKSGSREYAFAIGKDNGWLTHDGDIPGFNTDFGYLRKGGISIAVLVNSDVSTPQGLPATVIFNALAAALAPANAP